MESQRDLSLDMRFGETVDVGQLVDRDKEEKKEDTRVNDVPR